MTRRQWLSLLRLLTNHGMILVLILLCLVLSVITWSEQRPVGEDAAEQLAKTILAQGKKNIVIVSADTEEDRTFAATLRALLEAGATIVHEVIQGEPRDARMALNRLSAQSTKVDVFACSSTAAAWLLWADLPTDFPSMSQAKVQTAKSYHWPNFLKRENILNVANQIAVIAIVAIGMTMVIITAGIDLSVGSLIALSAVICALLIQHLAVVVPVLVLSGGTALSASALLMLLFCLVAILVCGLVGGFSGLMITVFRMPPFIVTLAVMLVASGIALRMTDGESVYEIPASFIWLGRGADILGIPNAVLLMLVLYALAHILMARTVLGRYLYAVGGNTEAARLSGVPIQKVIIFAYVCSGLLAGLGGVIMASQLKSGSPNYGGGYELQVIAAVVVGGTSLSGGEGSMLGTLLGALIIAVIQNGMNLTNVNPFTQKIVLGMVILAAVLLDRLKQRVTVAQST